MDESELRKHRNDFANRCFREVADKDYLAARTSYRFGLVEPFLWSSLQATEKYLKAILLYNGRTTKKISHNVEKAFNRVLGIADVPFDFPDSVGDFLGYLHRHASSRYLERPYYTMGRELLKLDHTVWHLRRYCRDLKAAPRGVSESRMLRLNLNSIALERWEKQPHKFRLTGGFLDQVADGRKGGELRDALIWKNPYYGSRYRRSLRNYKLRSQSSNPPHYLHRESYLAVKELVQFSKDVENDMSKE